MVSVTGIPVTTSITATSVVPQTTQPTNAMGSPPHLIEASRPGPRTPLRPLVVEWKLVNHPNKAFVKQLISDLVYGFSIGYHGPHFHAIAKHLSSALQHTNIIDESLRKETEAGRILGLSDSPPLPNLRCSGLEAIPKHDGG